MKVVVDLTLFEDKVLHYTSRFHGKRFNEKRLQKWVNRTWDHILCTTPLTHVGVREYNTFVSTTMEDQLKIAIEGPWFWGTLTLTLFKYHAHFDWIWEIIHTPSLSTKMTCLPIEFRDPKIFNIIGDSLGTFLKVILETEMKTTTFADTICVKMDMGQGIPKCYNDRG